MGSEGFLLVAQNFVAERAEGTYVYTTDGQRHLDMAAGASSPDSSYLPPCVIVSFSSEVDPSRALSSSIALFLRLQALEWSRLGTATRKW